MIHAFMVIASYRGGSPGAGFIGDPVQPFVMWLYRLFH
jgi:hypothetical protein